MTYDICTFNGENQMLKLHLGVLESHVDRFIIVEANKTFTGHDKPLHFFRDQRYFEKWWPKIDYYVVNDWDDSDLWEKAILSPNTKGASHWRREFYIKESIKKAMEKSHIQDEDMVIIGDVDEIIDPNAVFESNSPIKAKLRVYSYFLDNRSDEEFYGTLIAQYKDIKDNCLNHMRSDTSLYSKGPYLGWHFTNMGGINEVKRKLYDSYTEESYYTKEVQDSLEQRYQDNQDYLGRSFSFTTDDSEWPQYLKDNRKLFHRLIK